LLTTALTIAVCIFAARVPLVNYILCFGTVSGVAKKFLPINP
jgi:hypothetical protein